MRFSHLSVCHLQQTTISSPCVEKQREAPTAKQSVVLLNRTHRRKKTSCMFFVYFRWSDPLIFQDQCMLKMTASWSVSSVFFLSFFFLYLLRIVWQFTSWNLQMPSLWVALWIYRVVLLYISLSIVHILIVCLSALQQVSDSSSLRLRGLIKPLCVSALRPLLHSMFVLNAYPPLLSSPLLSSSHRVCEGRVQWFICFRLK